MSSLWHLAECIHHVWLPWHGASSAPDLRISRAALCALHAVRRHALHAPVLRVLACCALLCCACSRAVQLRLDTTLHPAVRAAVATAGGTASGPKVVKVHLMHLIAYDLNSERSMEWAFGAASHVCTLCLHAAHYEAPLPPQSAVHVAWLASAATPPCLPLS